MRSQFGRVIEECRKTFSDFQKLSLVHVKRSANMTAHALATMSCSFPDRVFDRRSVSIEVGTIVTSESYFCS